MKAVILAAGKGSRMKELSQHLPKPMFEVQGKPIIEHILSGLLGAGIRDVFIVTGYKAEAIENYFGDGTRWNARIAYGRQLVQDGTGKAPQLAQEFIGADDFILTYGDILVRPDTYPSLIRRFHEGSFAGVVSVIGSQDVTKGAINFFNDQFCLVRLVEKPTADQLEEFRQSGWLKPGVPAWYNAGIYVFRPLLFEYTARLQKSVRGEYELTDAVNAMALAGQQLAGLEIAGGWVDVRDPEVLAALQRGTWHK